MQISKVVVLLLICVSVLYPQGATSPISGKVFDVGERQ
jgi:hypothetical protein